MILKLLHENTPRSMSCYFTVDDDIASQSFLSPARKKGLVWKVGMRHQRDIKEVLYVLSFSCSQVSYVHISFIQLLKIKQLDTDVPCIDCSLPTTSSNNSLNLPGIFGFC